MESGPLSAAAFRDLGKKAVLFCHVTTQIDGRQDDDLLTAKGFEGFPSLAIMDADGEILVREVGQSVEEMSAAIDDVQEWTRLKAKVAAGEKGLEGKLFVAEVRLGKVSADDARAFMKSHKLAAEDVKFVEGELFSKELADWLEGARGGRMTPEEFFARIYGAYKEGRRPGRDESSQEMFWTFLLQGAENANDPDAFEVAYKAQLDRMRKGFEARLQSLRRKVAESKSGK